MKEIEVPSGTSSFIPGGVVLITDDEGGKADCCADQFAEFEVNSVVIRHRDCGQYVSKSYQADLTDAKQVADLIADIQTNLGPIAGVIHLLPFLPSEKGLAAERADLEVKSLYLITRAIEAEITEIAKTGSTFVLGATVLGGQLGFSDKQLSSIERAGSGAISGYLKCLGMEWPEVLVRSIDFPDSVTPKSLVNSIDKELSDLSGPFEVGYLNSRRYTWEPVNGVLDKSAPLEVGSDFTLLITGGARGITAAIAIEWARRYQSRMILLGRSPLPTGTEDAVTAGVTDKAALKKALMGQISASGDKPTPAEVEKRYKKLLGDREIRNNLSQIKSYGSEVEYRSVDVRDRKQLGAVFDELYESYSSIDGVIHGAGVIDDKLVKDKTPESFDRVFSTKVESSFAIQEFIKPDSLKFLSLFASIASRYGNQGQSDYAAANEVLCKLATELDKQWDARVFAVAWGPWGGIGMVSDLEKHLKARGIALIDEKTGCSKFIEEVIYGKKGDSEVIIAGGAENLVTPSTNQMPTAVVS